MNKLWYKAPAKVWTHSLPLGNGHIGAMLDGDIYDETIFLNDDTLWSGYPKDLHILKDDTCYKNALNETLNGKYTNAENIIEKNMLGAFTQSYLPLGNLNISYKYAKNLPVNNYIRELNLDTACHNVSYFIDDTKITRKSFINYKYDTLCININSSKVGFLSCDISISSLLKHSISISNSMIMLDGIAPSNVEPNYVNMPDDKAVTYSDDENKKGMKFGAYAKIFCDNNCISSNKNIINIQNATNITIILSAKTSFNTSCKNPYIDGVDYKKSILNTLENATHFKNMLDDHIKDYKSYFERLELTLPTNEKENLPTDERLINFTNDKDDISLPLLLFNYSRYLLISSSREDTQPANLQGIWNKDLRAPWSSNYTLNINTQMNYWAVEQCNLSSLHRPLLSLIDDICKKGNITAKKYYNASGSVVHHNTDIWRHTTPVGNHTKGSSIYGFWNLGTGFLAHHIYTHYIYTLDKSFLHNAYDMMKCIASFYSNLLIKNDDGHYYLPMSTSPENNFLYNDVACSICHTTTMTTSIVKEVFKNFIYIMDELSINDNLYKDIKNKLNNFIPYKLGNDGSMLEWNEDFKEIDPFHRHVSHLYMLFPSEEINFLNNPELMEACKKSLNKRGLDGTGWSLAWKINLYAKLRDGETALELINRQLSLVDNNIPSVYGGGTYLNLFDAHPPFQIDGNFGIVSGICNMLVESHINSVYLLKALPKKWHTGSLYGIKLKGNITLNMKWENMCPTYIALVSPIDTTLNVYYNNTNILVKLEKDTEYKVL